MAIIDVGVGAEGDRTNTRRTHHPGSRAAAIRDPAAPSPPPL